MSGLRVLDVSDGVARAAVRQLVGLGADVVRLDLSAVPGPPTVEDLHHLAGVRLVRPGPGQSGADLVAGLLPHVDVVLDGSADGRAPGVAWAAADEAAWAQVVHVVVTPYGLTGPCARWRGDDLTVASAGGMTWLGGLPDGPPSPPPRDPALHLAGQQAVIGALLAELARRRGGGGQQVDVSMQEAVAASLETGALSWIHGGKVVGRSGGVYAHVAHRLFAAADGWVAGGYGGPPRMWTDLLRWLVEVGAAEDLDDPALEDPAVRWRERGRIDAVLARFAAGQPAAVLAAEARRRALPWAEVVGPGQLLVHPQLLDRQFLVDVEVPGGPALRTTGFAADSPRRPRPVRLPAPCVTDVGAVWTDRRPARVPDPSVRWRGRRRGWGALDGLRVLDLTWVLAGPYVTRVLAEHGADVLKVESRHRKDPTRFAPAMRLRRDAGDSPDDSAYFANVNRGKRSVTLDLRSGDGIATLRDLARESDVVVENFSPGVLSRWGLDAAGLAELNPDAVLVSMSGAGQQGPWSSAVTFADTLAAMSGLTAQTAARDGRPTGLTFGLGDVVAANAALAALLDRLLADAPGAVDLSQLEALASVLGPVLVEQQLGVLPDRGDRRSDRAPRGVFRCAGEDRWVAVSVADDEQWQRLTQVAGLEPLALPERARLAGRLASQDELEAELTAWTVHRTAAEVTRLLQEAGVAAAPVHDGRDLVEEDEQLAARGFYVELDHPVIGRARYEGLVHHLSATPGRLSAPAPLLGQHTDEVLREVLGLDDARLGELHAAGVLQ